jgi:hypothetical protein
MGTFGVHWRENKGLRQIPDWVWSCAVSFIQKSTSNREIQSSLRNFEMSFEALTDRLKALQESNIQLKALIERLATINFQPGSLPLNDGDEGNIITELKLEIHQTLKDQEEDFEVLKEEVVDLDSGRVGGELEQQRNALIQAVDRALKELRTYDEFIFYAMFHFCIKN